MAHTDTIQARTATDVIARITAENSSGAMIDLDFDRRKFELGWRLKTLVPRVQSFNDVPGCTNDFLQENKQEWHKGRNEDSSERMVPPRRYLYEKRQGVQSTKAQLAWVSDRHSPRPLISQERTPRRSLEVRPKRQDKV